jgi:hypothetical protein
MQWNSISICPGRYLQEEHSPAKRSELDHLSCEIFFNAAGDLRFARLRQTSNLGVESIQTNIVICMLGVRYADLLVFYQELLVGKHDQL